MIPKPNYGRIHPDRIRKVATLTLDELPEVIEVPSVHDRYRVAGFKWRGDTTQDLREAEYVIAIWERYQQLTHTAHELANAEHAYWENKYQYPEATA